MVGEMTHDLRLPFTFWEDHTIGRDLPGGEVVKQYGRLIRVRCTDADLKEIEGDARHYADWGERAEDAYMRGLISSARATVRAIEAYRAKRPT